MKIKEILQSENAYICKLGGIGRKVNVEGTWIEDAHNLKFAIDCETCEDFHKVSFAKKVKVS